MKKLIILAFAAVIMIPLAAHAGKNAKTQTAPDEYGEYTLDPSVIEQVAPAPKAAKKSSVIEEDDVGTTVLAKAPSKKPPTKTGDSDEYGDEVEVVKKNNNYSSLGISAGDREGRFRVGFVGPGIGVASEGVGALATFGAEGEYFFFEKLSAGMRIEAMTHFSNATLVSFMPRARYVFDFDSYPRWAVYAQAGVGVALYNYAGSNYAALDVAIPGGGFWWQWTKAWSVGADTSLHIFVRSGATAVGFNLAPAIRYLF